MNDRKVINFQIFSAIFASVLGTILHFTYELSNNNLIVGAFSAVNESTWEHLKLLFIPMLITTIIGYLYLNENKDKFLCAKTIGIIVSMLFTIIFFYTYSGVLGTNLAIINILTFLGAIVLGEYVSFELMNSYIKCDKMAAIITLTILLISFIAFTYFSPKIGIFKDPIDCYGIECNR